jgi:hypothetical protein
MILRRVIGHVRNQEWTAILIDFLIVVVGVYLGIELGNWNDEHDARVEYQGALQRLVMETNANLTALDGIEPDILGSLQIVGDALDVLQTCEESESNRRIVNKGIAEIRGTYGIHLRRTALRDLTDNPRLLPQQSARERKRFTDMLFYFDMMEEEADFVEHYPFERPIHDNPIIGIGAREEITNQYFGVDYSRTQRALFLTVPLSEACKNDQLTKTIFTWEVWQDNLPGAIRQLRSEIAATQALLTERLRPAGFRGNASEPE